MLDERAYEIAKDLVAINSVNGTTGERTIGLWIEQLIRSFPYYQKHPNQLIIQELVEDPLGRRNVIAFVKGEGTPSTNDTILFHGHTDTVGIEDYGALKDVACKPEELMEQLKKMKLPDDIARDLLSGDYMFARGACDMKSGDAVLLALLERISNHPEIIGGNVVFSFNPVEENMHTGIIQALDVLRSLKEKYHLKYIFAVNNDFICPLFEGDTLKTIYTGMAGKLLPCFYIHGRETHVGQPFEGINAADLAAALVAQISLNPSLADTSFNETACPPTVLKMKDLKEHYDVQTPSEAFVYLNLFVLNSGNDVLTAKLKQCAETAVEKQLHKIGENQYAWAKMTKDQATDKQNHISVLSFDELCKECERKKLNFDMDAAIQKEIGTGSDAREAAIPLIRTMLAGVERNEPTIVLYYALPYCPHNTIKDQQLLDQLKEITDITSKKTGEKFRFRHFYPSLSDSSYICCDDSMDSTKLLCNCFPGMNVLYPLPIDKIKELSIPAINFGCYGKDAHKWTERVNIPYTFGVLPKLLETTILCFLQKEEDSSNEL